MYDLSLLGPVHVRRDGTPVHGFESRKALALLCYLAARGLPLTRTHLADLLWRDKAEARGRGNLSRVLNNLNALLPHGLEGDRDTVRLDPDAFWLDTRAFDQLAARGDAEALAAAADLYRDEFMAGIYLDDCPDFEIWLAQERAGWRGRMTSALDCLSGYHTQRWNYWHALQLTARLLQLEPWHEGAHRRMMLLLALTDQRSQALRQYETCCQVLAREFGAGPSAATTALYEQIRAGRTLWPPRPARTSQFLSLGMENVE